MEPGDHASLGIISLKIGALSEMKRNQPICFIMSSHTSKADLEYASFRSMTTHISNRPLVMKIAVQ